MKIKKKKSSLAAGQNLMAGPPTLRNAELHSWPRTAVHAGSEERQLCKPDPSSNAGSIINHLILGKCLYLSKSQHLRL